MSFKIKYTNNKGEVILLLLLLLFFFFFFIKWSISKGNAPGMFHL